MSKQVSDAFTSEYNLKSLHKEIEHCHHYELSPLFLKYFRDKQPVLEAGCGNGRWCAWFQAQSIESDGIDWSEELCQKASKNIPGSNFYACDMQKTNLPDGSYNGIVALGSVEHIIEGPQQALKEFYRLLKPNGIAIITVPFGGHLRIFTRYLTKPYQFAKSIPSIRKVFGKPVTEKSLQAVISTANKKWHPRFLYGPEGFFFYEYEFNKSQMREFLADANFFILEEFVSFGDEGIYQSFGKIAGKWNRNKAYIEFTIFGRTIKKLFSVNSIGHMLCYVVTKK